VERQSVALGGCLLLVYAFPTGEIQADTALALQDLEKFYVAPLGIRHPLVVFTDGLTATSLEAELGAYTSLPVVPAVIPDSALLRPMHTYSCVDGLNCVAGLEMPSAALSFGPRTTCASRGTQRGRSFCTPPSTNAAASSRSIRTCF